MRMTRQVFLYIAAALSLCNVQGQTRLISQTQSEIVIDFSLPDISVESLQMQRATYTRIMYERARKYFTPGAPVVPFSHFGAAIPPGATVSMEYEVMSQRQLTDITLEPATPVGELADAYREYRDETIYRSAAPYPGDIVQVGAPYVNRLMNTVDLSVYPIQFHPAEKRVRIIEKIRIRLKINGGRLPASPTTFSAVETDYHQQRLVNFELSRNWATDRRARLQKSNVNYDFNTGDWFKIPVVEEGVYQVTGANLRDLGVDISQVIVETIQMFNNGGDPLPVNVNTERPQELNEVAIQVIDRNGNGQLDDDDAVLFFGRATHGWRGNGSNWTYQVNPYSSTNYYMLTYNQAPGKRIAVGESPQIAGAAAVTQFVDRHFFYEDQENILESGLDWYWERFQGTADEHTFTFDLPQGIVPGDAVVNFRLKGGSGSRWFDTAGYRYTVDFFLNSQEVASNLVFSRAGDSNRALTVNNLNPGGNTLQLSYSGNLEGCFMFMDYFSVETTRQLRAENSYLKFYQTVTSAPLEYTITSLPTGTNRVWDISDFANVRQINPIQNGATVRFQDVANAPEARCYAVFGDAYIKEVTGVERMDNRPNLRSADRVGKLLIVTSDDLFDATGEWESFKESLIPNAIQTERIRVEDIYREFSSAVPDPAAIRDFLKYAYENWGSNTATPSENRPHYVQIVGDGSYDYRNIELADYQNQVPVYEITANDDVRSRCTDNFFTAFGAAGNNNLDPQLPIGRFPANSSQQVSAYVNKMRAYNNSFMNERESSAGWQTTITLIADDECASGGRNCNEYMHTSQSESIFTYIPRKFDVSKIYMVDYATQAGGLGRQKPQATRDLLDQINRGTLIINFFGHGDPNTWAHEQVLTRARDFPLIQNSGRLPMWIAATCTWGKYDDPRTPSMAEEMVWSQEGGGILSLAASRATYSFDNLDFVKFLFRDLFNNADSKQRSRLIGDALVLTLNGDDNDQKYHLFGDITQQLADPEYQVKVESMSSDTLKALSKVSLDAVITDRQGNLLSDFNGKALIRVYDAIDSVFNTTINRRYVYQGGTIFKGVVSVTNGRIEDAGFIVPKSIKYKKDFTGRVSIYAWSEDGDAAGFKNELLFFGTESQVNDAQGPSIHFSFPEQPDFFDGDFVRQQTELVIDLEDDNGINLTGELGHRIELIIDDNIRKDVTEFFVYDVNSFSRGQLRYTLPALASGNHTIQISAWDNLNNYSESLLSFTTTSTTEMTLANVVNYPNPFENETIFTFQFQSPGGVAEATIKIYTVTGRLIREINGVARPGFNKIPWDGLDEEGQRIANGVYLYKVVVDDGEKVLEKIEKLAITR